MSDEMVMREKVADLCRIYGNLARQTNYGGDEFSYAMSTAALGISCWLQDQSMTMDEMIKEYGDRLKEATND